MNDERGRMEMVDCKGRKEGRKKHGGVGNSRRTCTDFKVTFALGMKEGFVRTWKRNEKMAKERDLGLGTCVDCD